MEPTTKEVLKQLAELRATLTYLRPWLIRTLSEAIEAEEEDALASAVVSRLEAAEAKLRGR